MEKPIKLTDKELDKLIKVIGADNVIYKHIYWKICLSGKQLEYTIEQARQGN